MVSCVLGGVLGFAVIVSCGCSAVAAVGVVLVAGAFLVLVVLCIFGICCHPVGWGGFRRVLSFPGFGVV